MAPEIIEGNGYSYSIDFYTLGALLFEFMVGLPPYYDSNPDNILNNIVNHQLDIPLNIPKNVRSLLTKLLEKDPKKRIKTFESLKACEWLRGINWTDIKEKKNPAPLAFSIYSSNIHDEFANMVIEKEPNRPFKKKYHEFYYIEKNLFRKPKNLTIEKATLFSKLAKPVFSLPQESSRERNTIAAPKNSKQKLSYNDIKGSRKKAIQKSYDQNFFNDLKKKLEIPLSMLRDSSKDNQKSSPKREINLLKASFKDSFHESILNISKERKPNIPKKDDSFTKKPIPSKLVTNRHSSAAQITNSIKTFEYSEEMSKLLRKIKNEKNSAQKPIAKQQIHSSSIISDERILTERSETTLKEVHEARINLIDENCKRILKPGISSHSSVGSMKILGEKSMNITSVRASLEKAKGISKGFLTKESSSTLKSLISSAHFKGIGAFSKAQDTFSRDKRSHDNSVSTEKTQGEVISRREDKVNKSSSAQVKTFFSSMKSPKENLSTKFSTANQEYSQGDKKIGKPIIDNYMSLNTEECRALLKKAKAINGSSTRNSVPKKIII